MRLAIRRNTLLLIMGLLAVVAFLVMRPWMAYILFGLAIGYVMRPYYTRTSRRTGRPGLMAIVFTLGALVAIVGPFLWLGWQVAGDAIVLAQNLDPEAAEAWLNSTASEPGPMTRAIVMQGIPALEGALSNAAGSALGIVSGMVVGLFLTLIVIHYTLTDGGKLIQWGLEISPLDPRREQHMVEEAGRVLRAVFLGQAAASVSQGLAAMAGYWIFGVPNFFFWGFATIITSVLPVIGPAIVWGPAVAYLFLFKGPVWGLGLMLWSVVVVSNVDNIARGRIVGSSAGLHPGLTVLSAIGGLEFFGFVGFLMGPLAIAMFLLVMRFWQEEFVEMHGLNPVFRERTAEPLLPHRRKELAEQPDPDGDGAPEPT